MTEMTFVNVQKAITHKVSQPYLQFCRSTHGATRLKKLTVIFNVQTRITQKVIKPDLRFLCSTCHRSSFTFLEGFKKIAGTVFKLQKGHTYMTGITIYNVQRAVTPKASNSEL